MEELSQSGKVAKQSVETCTSLIIENGLLEAQSTADQLLAIGIHRNLVDKVSEIQRKLNSEKSILTSVMNLDGLLPESKAGRQPIAVEHRVEDIVRIFEKMSKEHSLGSLDKIAVTLMNHRDLHIEATDDTRKFLWETLNDNKVVTYGWGCKNHSVTVSISLDGPIAVIKMYNTGVGTEGREFRDGKLRPTEYRVSHLTESKFNDLLVDPGSIQSAKKMYDHVEAVLRDLSPQIIITPDQVSQRPQDADSCAEDSLQFLVKDLIKIYVPANQDKRGLYLEYKVKNIESLMDRLQSEDQIQNDVIKNELRTRFLDMKNQSLQA